MRKKRKGGVLLVLVVVYLIHTVLGIFLRIQSYTRKLEVKIVDSGRTHRRNVKHVELQFTFQIVWKTKPLINNSHSEL